MMYILHENRAKVKFQLNVFFILVKYILLSKLQKLCIRHLLLLSTTGKVKFLHKGFERLILHMHDFVQMNGFNDLLEGVAFSVAFPLPSSSS